MSDERNFESASMAGIVKRLQVVAADMPAAARRDFEGEGGEMIAQWIQGYLEAALVGAGAECLLRTSCMEVAE